MDKHTNWRSLFCKKPTPVESVASYKSVNVTIKRDDLNHEIIQGNKLRKLKYNFKEVINKQHDNIVTFGGAHSNHIIATAKAAKYCGIKCTGFIRGDELQFKPDCWSVTLKNAQNLGMELVFISRESYRKKMQSKEVQEHLNNYTSNAFLIPEGGSNSLSVRGASETIDELTEQITMPTHIISACGTGGTCAGLIDGVVNNNWSTKIIGIPVLKGADFLLNEVKSLSLFHQKARWQLLFNYHAGGYAKLNEELIVFNKEFTLETGILLDKIYNIKSFFAAYDLIKKEKIKAGSSIVILHTGGLQGGIISP